MYPSNYHGQKSAATKQRVGLGLCVTVTAVE